MGFRLGHSTSLGSLGGQTAGRLASAPRAIRPPDCTHDVAVIGDIDRFVSVNAALEIDLFGQVNAESLDGASTDRSGSGAGAS
jgi:acyl-CoA hydrolase